MGPNLDAWARMAQPKTDDGVTRYTPDPKAYHDLGAGAVMVPAATRFGASKGASTAPGKVNIVSGDGSSIELDLKQVTKSAMAAAMQSSPDAEDAVSVFAALSRQQRAPQPVVAPPTPVQIPVASVAAPPVQNGTPMNPYDPNSYATIPQQPVAVLPAFAQAAPPQPQVLAPQPQATDYGPLILQLAEQLKSLTANQATLQEALKPAVPEPRTAAPEQDITPIQRFADETGFPYLTDPPSKPRLRVQFRMPDGSELTTRVHHAEHQEPWLYLYLDTRYEGDRYTPPSTSPENPLRVTLLDENKTYHAVLAPGGTAHHGCLQVIGLITQPTRSGE